MSSEAITTSEIEGENLDRESVKSSIRRHLHLESDNRRGADAEEGIAELMVDLYRTTSEPLSHPKLFSWHRMLLNGRTNIGEIGGYRSHEEPMQVISRIAVSQMPRVHFEAPPSRQVPAEMERFISWFNRTAPGGPDPLPALARAGVTHHYFVSIHPFEDGNGRIGRALTEKALAQTIGQPTHTSLAAAILNRRKDYYKAIELNNCSNDVTACLNWFGEVAGEAQSRTLLLVEFLLAKTRLFDRLRGQLNDRQEKALARMFREGAEGFKGGLSADNYMTITRASSTTATRDLVDLIAKRALIKKGELRYTRYFLNL
jgi:Fic family protein